MVPMVNESNAMAEELGKKVTTSTAGKKSNKLNLKS